MPRRLLVSLLVIMSVASVAFAQAYGGKSGSGYKKPIVVDENAFRRFEVIMEGGLALPTGNLGADPGSEEAAMGGETGFMLGLRGRIYFSRNFSLAPAFSYTEFGDYDGRTADDEVYTVMARVLRYGLDFTYITSGRFKQVRPFAGVGAAFVRNKYREDYVDAETYYSAGVNGIAGSLHAGLRWRIWELSADYQFNRFSSPVFLPTGVAVDYDWSQLTLRIGFALPYI